LIDSFTLSPLIIPQQIPAKNKNGIKGSRIDKKFQFQWIMSCEKDKNINYIAEEQPDQKDLEGVDNTNARKMSSFKL